MKESLVDVQLHEVKELGHIFTLFQLMKQMMREKKLPNLL